MEMLFFQILINSADQISVFFQSCLKEPRIINPESTATALDFPFSLNCSSIQVTMKLTAALATVSLLLVGSANAACPNSCSGHGTCGAFDACTCDRNWQGADCSQRTCPYGRAHVDSPKGDLDASNSIEGTGDLLIEGSTVWPYGTTELYPDMSDTAGNALIDTAHDYMECSNKGMCDRSTGQCECLPGYDGAACNRASCPSKRASGNTQISTDFSSNIQSPIKKGVRSSFLGRPNATPMEEICSGHGVCKSIADLAAEDGNNRYALWDHDVTMACKCDPGYGGPDCAQRQCLHGIDPLYTDDATVRVTHATVHFETTAANVLSGTYALKFFDTYGEDYITDPLPLDGTGVIDGVDHCDYVVDAFKALPNGVVPDIECTQTVIDTNRGVEYDLAFIGNPGVLKQIEIEQYLDGSRSTIVDSTDGHPFSAGDLTMGVYTKVNGESDDFFPTRCEGITVKVLADSSNLDNSWNADVRPGSLGYLTGPDADLTAAEAKILKRCLSDSDHDAENNVDVANWDKGFVVEADGATPDTYNMIGAFPHAIKVVPKESTLGYSKFSYGQYYLVWYDETATAGKEFRVANLNDNHNLRSEATESYVYTTTGTVQQLGYGDEVEQEIADNSAAGASSTRIVGYFDKFSNKIYTNYDTSCENNPDSGDRNHKCVEKGDMLFVVDGCWGEGDKGSGTTNPFFGGPTVSCADSTDVNYGTGNVLYNVTRVYTLPVQADTATDLTATIDIVADPTGHLYVGSNVIEVDRSFSWSGALGFDPANNGMSPADDTQWASNTGFVSLFHYTPPSYAGLNEAFGGLLSYVDECSSRGNCNRKTGSCECFLGYTGPACDRQDALAGYHIAASAK